MNESDLSRLISEKQKQTPHPLSRRDLLTGHFLSSVVSSNDFDLPGAEQQQQISEQPDFLPSRQKFLAMIAGVPVALYFGRPLYEQFDDWDRGGVENDVFLQMHKEKLKNLRLGTTFVPSEFGGDKDFDADIAMSALKYAVEELGINEIRFPLRWDLTAPESETVDLSFYDPYLRYMMDHGVKICPSFGYKAARWPEHYAPEYITSSDIMLPDGAQITPEDALGKKALNHIELLCAAIKERYDYDFSEIQIENEPFQKFGKVEQTFDFDYIRQGMDIARKYYPEAEFLVNGGGPDRLPAIIDFFEHLTTEDPSYKGKLRLGYDYYFDKPDNLPVIEKIDPITKDQWLGNAIQLAQKRSKDLGYQLEITEGQAENWGGKIQPRDSIDAFRFMLLRGMRVLDMSQPSLLRIWGIEKMYKKKIGIGPENSRVWTEEDELRHKLIRAINTQDNVEEISRIYERLRKFIPIRRS